MPVFLSRLLVAVSLCLAACPAAAEKVVRIDLKGLNDARLDTNVRSALSLNAAIGTELRPRRLRHLLQIAQDETRTALEPFGYYAPSIRITRSDRVSTDIDDTDEQDTDISRSLTVTINIDLGDPVKVRHIALAVDGDGQQDTGVIAALDAFHPRTGEVLDHGLYETSKARIALALAQHGYFDAELRQHRVEVTRAQHAADIALQWDSGLRHTLGRAQFTQQPTTILHPSLLDKLVPWTPGDAYDEAQLDRLRQSLVALDYFSLVDVQADTQHAATHQVPVHVQLTPAKRSIYSVGASYGTLTGAGISAGIERRYLNQRGHKALAQFDWAEQRKSATLQYRIPAFAWLDGWYSASLQAADEQTRYVNSRRIELVASRSGQYNRYLNLAASLHVLRERWAYASLTKPVQQFQFASFVYPALRAEYIDVDDRMAPRRGAGGTLTLRGGKGGSDGRATFTQLHASVQWFHGFDADSRLIARGELGHTFTRDLLNLPPSLRFYAGGDRSVRGYGWHEIGPMITTPAGRYFTGAPNMLAASVEYERYFHGPWGAAVFVDTGDAFSGKRASLRTGVGIGLRWRSPVGPVRIDIARGLDQPDAPFTLHLNIGADL